MFKKNSKIYKLNYFSTPTLRRMFLIYSNPIYQSRDKYAPDRSSTIPNLFVNYLIGIHTGRRFLYRNINCWMVGFKFGEFTWNRKMAIYKAKQKRKKKKKGRV